MANKPFDREIINTRERPFSSDVNLINTYSDLALRETLRAMYSQRTSLSDSTSTLPETARFLGDAFRVRSSSPASGLVMLTPGIGFVFSAITEENIGGILGVNDTSTLKPLVLSQPQFFSVPAATTPRIDIIEVKANSFFTDAISRDIFSSETGQFEPVDLKKTLSWALDGNVGYTTFDKDSTAAISFKTGSPSSFTPPATTSGYTKICEIVIPAPGEVLIQQGSIADCRILAAPYGQIVVAGKIQLPRSVLLTSSVPDALPQIVSLHAPPGIDVGCFLNSVGSEIDFTFNDYQIVVLGSYSAISATVQMDGFNRFNSIVDQGLSNDLAVTSYNVWIDRFLKSSEVGSSRKQLLESPDATRSPISVNERTPAVSVTFSFKQAIELLQGSDLSPFAEKITDPIFVYFSIVIA